MTLVTTQPIPQPDLISQVFNQKKENNQDPNLDLYAFRTIVTMLALLRPQREIPDKREKPDSKKLRILDALAAIITRKHGVAVVVAHPHDDTGTTQVLTRFNRENRTQFAGDLLDSCPSFLTAQNPRRLKKKRIQRNHLPLRSSSI